jgi:plastocyanin
MQKWMRATAVLLVATAVASGCIDESDDRHAGQGAAAGDTTSASEPAAHAETVAAVLSEWAIALDPASVDAGTITFEVRNDGAEAHVFEIEGGGEQWRTDEVAPNGTATLSVALAPGTYNVYCPLDSGGEAHADRGMKTMLRVQ